MLFVGIKKKVKLNIFLNKLTRLLLCMIVVLFFLSPMEAESSVSLERRQKENKAKISRLKWLESLESNKLYRNQRKLEQTRSNLQYSKVRYTSAKVRLGVLESEYKDAQKKYSEIAGETAKRIRNIYKQQRYGLVGAILSTTDINTLSDVIYYQNLIMKRDKEGVAEARNIALRLRTLKQQIEVERDPLARSISEIAQQQKSIQQAIVQNSNMIDKLRSDREYYERTERELAKQSSSLGDMINKTQTSSIVIASANFQKPISGRITSPFGWRIHPIFKSRTFHSGIDIAGPYGGTVRAANNGKVIFVNWYGGYGKVVIVDHGTINGAKITTLYAHLNSYKVKVGDIVQKGAPLGIQGSTGYSTGPHLHFEVRSNGKPTNPLNYI